MLRAVKDGKVDWTKLINLAAGKKEPRKHRRQESKGQKYGVDRRPQEGIVRTAKYRDGADHKSTTSLDNRICLVRVVTGAEHVTKMCS